MARAGELERVVGAGFHPAALVEFMRAAGGGAPGAVGAALGALVPAVGGAEARGCLSGLLFLEGAVQSFVWGGGGSE